MGQGYDKGSPSASWGKFCTVIKGLKALWTRMKRSPVRMWHMSKFDDKNILKKALIDYFICQQTAVRTTNSHGQMISIA
jgi:hypothetical protein